MRPSGKRHGIDAVHLRLRQRQGRRIDHNGLSTVPLHEPLCVVRVCFEVRDLRHLAEGDRVVANAVVVGKLKRRVVAWRWLARAEPIDNPTQVSQVFYAAALSEKPSHIQHGALPHPEHHKIGLGVHQDRPANGVAPVVVVRDSPQARLNASCHNRHTRIGLTRPLAVGECCSIWPSSDLPIGGVRIVVPDLPVGGIVVDHGVHVAGRDAEKKPRAAKLAPGLATSPIRLRQDGYAISSRLQQSPDQGVCETGMVNVGITADQHHVDAVPAAALHFFP